MGPNQDRLTGLNMGIMSSVWGLFESETWYKCIGDNHIKKQGLITGINTIYYREMETVTHSSVIFPYDMLPYPHVGVDGFQW